MTYGKFFAYWEILHVFLSSDFFFQNTGLVRVKIVCEGYQQMAKVGKELRA